MNLLPDVGYYLASISKYPLMFLLAYLFTYLLVPVVIKMAPRIGMIDIPDARRVHRVPTPRGGGMAVWAGFHLAMALLLCFAPGLFGNLDAQWWLAFLAGSGVLFVVGVIDDIRGVSPLFKLAGQAAAVVILILMGGSSMQHLFGWHLPSYLDWPLTLLWFLALINAFNLIDGLDGLCSGLAMIASIGQGGAFLMSRDSADMIVALALAGSCLGFLRYNFNPAKIFLGDTGSMFLGFALASLALETAAKSTVAASLGVAVLAMGVPIFDTLLAIWRRSVRKALAGKDGGAVMGADKDHLHHRLLASGLSTRKVAVVLYIASASLVIMGLLSLAFNRASLAFYVVTMLLGVYVIVRHVAHIELWDTGRLVSLGLRKPRPRQLSIIVYVAWDLFSIALSLAVAYLIVPDMVAERTIGSRAEWLLNLPFWMLPVFLILFLARTYQRVWSKAGAMDFFILQAACAGGWLVAFAVQIIFFDGFGRFEFARAFVFGGLFYAMVMGGRSVSQLLTSLGLMASVRRHAHTETRMHRVVIYGVTDRAMLLLKQIESSLQEGDVLGHPMHVLGFVDDDRNLRQRIVKGFPVFGGIEDLSAVLDHQPVEEILVTCDLTPGRRHQLERLVRKHHLEAREWCHEFRELRTETGTPWKHTEDAQAHD